MAKIVSKQLKLIGLLDDTKIRQQLRELKKEVGDLNLGGGVGGPGGAGLNVGNFQKVVKELSDAATALKAIADSFKPGRAGVAARSGGATKGGGIRQLDPVTGNYHTISGTQVYNPEMRKVFDNRMDEERALYHFREREDKKLRDKEAKALEKQRKENEREEEKIRRQNTKAVKDTLTAGLATKVSMPIARQISEALSGLAPEAFNRTGGALRAAGRGEGLLGAPVRFAKTGLGMGLMGGAAIAGLGVAALMSAQMNQRSVRTQLSGMDQEIASSVMSGNLTEASIRRHARGSLGTIERNAAAMLGAAKTMIPFTDSFGASREEGARLAVQRRGDAEIEALMAETSTARGALSRARGYRAARIANLRGGDITSEQLNQLQIGGAGRGFSIQETNRQFAALRSMMGGQAGGALTQLQRLSNITGASIEDLGSATDAFMGARGGTTGAQAAGQSFEFVKKAIAAGFDFSTSGKALKTTGEFIKANQGLADIDESAIGTALLQASAGFAGGKPITDTNLSQATSLMASMRQESMSMGGLEGLGNIMGIMEAAPNLDTNQIMAAMSIPNDATPEDVMKLLNVDRDTAERILESKGQNLTRGVGAATSDPMLQAIITSQQKGISSIEAQNRLEVQSGMRGEIDTTGVDITQGERSMKESEDFQSLKADLLQEHASFIVGTKLMADESKNAGENLKDFNTQLQNSARILRDMWSQTLKRE